MQRRRNATDCISAFPRFCTTVVLPVRILIVAATRPEVGPLIAAVTNPVEHHRLISGAVGAHSLDILLTGVGMVDTAVWCSRALAIGGYDVALNLGVCGSFAPAFPQATVVHVTCDMFSELGAQDGPHFLPLQDLGLLEPDLFPYSGGRLVKSRITK